MTYRMRTDKTWAETERDIRTELARWGAKTYSLTVPNAPPKTTRVRSWKESPEEATVELIAHWPDGRELRLQYNKQERAVDNARVLYLAIEAMRKNEKRGIGDVLREAYLQLPPPEAEQVIDPYEVLGVSRTAPLAVAEAAWKALMVEAHPDKGGSEERAKLLNKAIEMVREERGR